MSMGRFGSTEEVAGKYFTGGGASAQLVYDNALAAFRIGPVEVLNAIAILTRQNPKDAEEMKAAFVSAFKIALSRFEDVLPAVQLEN